MATYNYLRPIILLVSFLSLSSILVGQCVLNSGTYNQSDVATCLTNCGCTEIQIPSGATVTMNGDWDLTSFDPITFTILGLGSLIFPGNGNNASTLSLVDGSVLIIEDPTNSSALVSGNSANVPRIVIGDISYYPSDFSTLISNGGSPVVLIDFNVSRRGGDVVFEWSTASEIENDFFTIEVSPDGLSWIEVGRMDGHGTTGEISKYKYVCTHIPLYSTYYFRLSQTDYDGTMVHLAIRKLVDSFDKKVFVQKGSLITLYTIDGHNTVSVMDINGKFILGNKRYGHGEIVDLSYLNPGIYIISFAHGTTVKSEMLFIN